MSISNYASAFRIKRKSRQAASPSKDKQDASRAIAADPKNKLDLQKN